MAAVKNRMVFSQICSLVQCQLCLPFLSSKL